MARRKKPQPDAASQAQPVPQANADEPSAEKPSAGESTNAKPLAWSDMANKAGFPVVGIGASAGGLAAFEAFFSAMPADTESGMAFVLVQHLSPDHKSILTDLVKRYTSMQVFEVKDGMEVQPNCAYIIPPNRDMAFLNGTLQLLEQSTSRGLRLPIDFFFRSLAQDQHERAICIVLSGTGSDGTLGVRAVKGEGGMVMAQSIDSTAYDGMPRSAIATGLVDYVLPPAEMPAQLIAYVKHAFGNQRRAISAQLPATEDTLKKICVVLRAHTSHDFSQYKENTLVRRIERRMALNQIEQPTDYLRYLQKEPAEVDALFRDLLIGVTNFFRDPEAFTALQAEVIPLLFAGKQAGATLRVWVCGCSTGEEAYSIAILIQEHLQLLKQSYRVQVFATDIDSHAIETARAGVYPTSIAADISSERLAQFFDHDVESSLYRIQKSIRDMLIFSEQNVIKDPPFSKLDLISCRNLLIYMNSDLQKRLIPLFHYALAPGGSLFLGTSESVGEFTTHFSVLDRKWKLYRRQPDILGGQRAAIGDFVPPLVDTLSHQRAQRRETRGEAKPSLREITEQALLRHFAQAGVLISGRGDVLYIYGRTGKYLEPAPGDGGMNILSMAREGLRRELTSALHRAVTQVRPVGYTGLRVRTNGSHTTANLVVAPVLSPEGNLLPDMFLVILNETEPEVTPSASLSPQAAQENIVTDIVTDTDQQIAALEQELRAKEEYLQTTLEEMETANEELKSTNEEMQSVNEEMQSTNEELETSKEELQSLNEELATLNAELQAKVADLSRANNDMNNLLAGTGIGTLFVDHQLRITRFTPATTQLINLIQSDIGRPVGHIVSNLMGYDTLVSDAQAVLQSLLPFEAEVQTKSGAWYVIRIRPYRTLENVIEGAVITFMDITEIKRKRQEASDARRLADAIVDTVPLPLLVLDSQFHVLSANQPFYTTFQVKKEQTVGKLLFTLGNRQWNIPQLRHALEQILPDNSILNAFAVTHDFEEVGKRTFRVNARRVVGNTGSFDLLLLAFEDVSA